MKITPSRAIALMWLLCSAWLPGIWWLQRLLPASASGDAMAALPVLGGGLLLLLLAALFLVLSVRIEQTRLRMAVRAELRGDSAADAGAEWRGVLDDVRLAMRRVGLERERLALRAQQAEDALREQGERASQAARAAQDSLQRLRYEWQGLLPVLPSAREGGYRLQATQDAAQAVDAVRTDARQLRQGVEALQPALQQLRGELADAGAKARSEFLPRATQLAESLQLLSLNFRLVLERLELLPGVQGEGLDDLVQDLEPLCVQATALLEALPRDAGAGVALPHDALAPLEQAVSALPQQLARVLDGLELARGSLDALLPEAREAAMRDVRGVLEKSLQDWAEASGEMAVAA